jgi:hypothetical protein
MELPTKERPEVIAMLRCKNAVHAIVLWHEDKGWLECWHAEYWRSSERCVATLGAMTREKLEADIAMFLSGHARQLLLDLIADSGVGRN